MRPTIIVTSAAPWDGITQRPHHIAKELARRGWDVLFVDYPITLLGPIKNRSLLCRMIPQPLLHNVLSSENGGSLTVVSPSAILPFGNMLRGINRFNQHLISTQMNQTLTRDCILLSTLPSSADLIPWIHPKLVFYDCVDSHAHFTGLIDLDVVNLMEKDIAYASKAVFATANALASRMQEYNRDVRLVPNAAEINHFASAKNAPLHPLLKSIPEPRIGFIGGIASWVHLRLLEEIALARPHIQLVMVGPIETDIHRLSALPNVHFLGRQPYLELPQLLHGFSATLYAFVDNELTKSVNPIKVYEYIAADKEVIATPTDELLKFADFVWLAEDCEQAVTAIDRILSGERKASAELREQFNRMNSWAARADKIEQAIIEWLP